MAGCSVAAAEGVPTPAVRYVIVGSPLPAPEFELDAVLASPALAAYGPATASLGLASCLSAWREEPGQAAACIQSRIPTQGHERVVVLMPVAGSAPDLLEVECIGPAHRRRATMRAASPAANAAAIGHCLDGAAQDGQEPSLQEYAVRSGPLPVEGERTKAAAEAAAILVIAVDHVGIPRGLVGPCWIGGRIHAVRLGAALSPRGVVDFSVRCSPDGKDQNGTGTIAMAGISAGTFAEVYLDQSQRVLDFRPAQPEVAQGATTRER